MYSLILKFELNEYFFPMCFQVTLLKPSNDQPAPLIPAICLAIGEIGCSSALLLPPGESGDDEEKITKLYVVNTLLKMVKSSKETNKVRDKVTLCYVLLFLVSENCFYKKHTFLSKFVLYEL